MSEYTPNKKPEQDIPNRGYDNRVDRDDAAPIRVSLKTVDEAIITYITDIIKPQITVGDQTLVVPVVYGTQERWKSIRVDGYLREERSDKARTPLIMIRRTGLSKSNPNNPNNKYLYTVFDTGWNKRNIYDRFAVLNGVTPSQQLRQVIIPDYVSLNYEVILWTEFNEQMNELIEQIHFENEEYWGLRNQFKFRIDITDYADNSELPASDVRVVRSSFNIKAEGYLIPEKATLKYKPIAPNQNIYTRKKVVVFSEVTGSI